jgi:hypothetical protein
MANDCIPYKFPGEAITAKAKGAVKGKTFVKIGGDRTGGGKGGAEGSTTVGVGLSTDLENLYQVETCGAKGAAVGVAGWDAADKGELKVWAGPGTILPVTAGGTVEPGDQVESDAEGKAVKGAAAPGTVPLGVAMAKGATGKDVEIKLY